MLTVSSSSLTPSHRRPVLFRRRQSSSCNDFYRPRTITIEKAATSTSYGFSIQTYAFASLNFLSVPGSASSLLSLSSESTESRQSSAANSLCSVPPTPPIQLVTYVDHVQDKSPAWEAGLRAGSVIISVNDQTVEHDDHETLVKRITDSSSSQLKLIVVQQNIDKQIALCEQLQKLHKQLNDKQEELADLCKQETSIEGDPSGAEEGSPSPYLQHRSSESVETSPSYCHHKIPLDWRQSVADFAHQQNSNSRMIPPIVNLSSSAGPSKYIKTRSVPRPQAHQRSLSLSTIVFHCSKPSFLRSNPHRPEHEKFSRRRALSFEELFSSRNTNANTSMNLSQVDQSLIGSGCSLAMDLSRNCDMKNHSSSSSESDTEVEEASIDETFNQKIKQLKWKLRINK